MSFPVWRELKLTHYCCRQWPWFLTMSFPVWRELKLETRAGLRNRSNRHLQCPFPFEGNWNHFAICAAVEDGKGVLQCPFPFEGNWNQAHLLPKRCWWKRLTMSFPVWRELKQWCDCRLWQFLLSYNVLSRLKGIETGMISGPVRCSQWLTMSFPVWRELKPLMYPWWISSPRILQCPFPFEGNWNDFFLLQLFPSP